MEGIITRPSIMKINIETIKRILLDAGINSDVAKVDEPHPWVMQSQRIYLEDGRKLLLKVAVNLEWTDASSILNQVKVSEIISSTGIPQPKIISYCDNITNYGFMFILSEAQEGIRLNDRYKSALDIERKEIYKALGRSYSLIHSIKNDWAGVWDGDHKKMKYPIHPAEFYKNAEIYNGSNKYLLENNIISKNLYKRICSVWDDNISYLKQRPNSLVHISPFPWSIYILKKEKEFSVGGFSALGDFMWWDPMSDVAHLLYPPFMNITTEEQNAFISEYNIPLDERSINLYFLLNRVCAMAGCYLAPKNYGKTGEWINQEIKRIEDILRKLENLGRKKGAFKFTR